MALEIGIWSEVMSCQGRKQPNECIHAGRRINNYMVSYGRERCGTKRNCNILKLKYGGVLVVCGRKGRLCACMCR